MKNLSLKISLIIFSYVLLIILIILSYVSIVPEDSLVILENKSPLVKKIENNFGEKNDTVYKILEKPKKIEDLIENQLTEKKSNTTVNKNSLKIYRLQFASFMDKEKSLKTSKKILKNNFFKEKKIDLDIKKINQKNNKTFYRVVSSNFFLLKEANSHCELLKKKKINCIVIKD